MEKKAEAGILSDRAYHLGFGYEKQFRGCGQCTLAAIQDALEMTDDAVFKAATAFAGGIALLGTGICGGFAGGVLFFGQMLGRDRSHFADPDKIIRRRCYQSVRKLHDRFIQEFGAIQCCDIQTKIFGRPYDLKDPDQYLMFEAAGAHTSKCLDVVGKAARWAVEIVSEEGGLT